HEHNLTAVQSRIGTAPNLIMNFSRRNTTTTIHSGGLDWNRPKATSISETRRFYSNPSQIPLVNSANDEVQPIWTGGGAGG
ncbi:hypothetical protein A2U01_0058278, partial [Trifolium medium]|nr:hypothetical protein [Trifolium medium]